MTVVKQMFAVQSKSVLEMTCLHMCIREKAQAHRHRVNVLSVCLVVFKRVTPKMVGTYIKNQSEETGIGAEL